MLPGYSNTKWMLKGTPARKSGSGSNFGGAMSEVRTRAEVREWILTQVRQRPGCQDFSQEFRLLGNGPNWECIPTNCYDWDRASLEAFDQVVGDARRRFELLG